MNATKALLALSSLVAAGSASAVTLDLSQSQLNGNTATDFSPLGAISIDISFVNDAPVTLALVLEAGDGSTLSMDGLFANLTQEGWTGLSVELGIGATWLSQGDVSGDFSDTTAALISPSLATISFVGPEFSGLEFGAVDGGANSVDWLIDVNELFPGSVISVTLSPTPVPLPAAVWLLGAALVPLGSLRRR